MKKILPFLLLISTLQVMAQSVPGTLSYQGILLQADGITPITDGNHTVLFRFYTVSTGGTAIAALSRTVTVTTSKGLFTCIIGGGTAPNAPFSAADMTTLSSQQIFIGISVNGGAELAPRAQLTPSTYALQAQNAYNVSNNSITSEKIADGTIVNADISNSAAIAGSKIAPTFGAQNISTTGTITGGVSTLSRLSVIAGSVAVHPLNVSGFTGTTRTSALFSDGNNSSFRIAHPTAQVVAMGGNIDHGLRLGGFNSADASFSPWMTFAPNTGNVGIGTATPNTKLDVVGNMRLYNNDILFRGGTDPNHGIGYYGTDKLFNAVLVDGPVVYGASGGALGSFNGATRNIALRWTSAGNVGIGTATPNAPLQFASTVANRKIVLYDVTNNDHNYFGFGIVPSGLRYQVDIPGSDHIFFSGVNGGASSTELMRIRGNGNVGIGTSAPSSRLHVLGNTFITGTNTNSVAAAYSSVEFATGRLGLGGLNSGQTNADISFQYGGPGGGFRHYISTRHSSTGNSFENAIDFYINNSNISTNSRVSTNGNEEANLRMMSISAAGVGIGTQLPDQRLSVNGNASKVGGGSWATFSDRRMKKDIVPFSDGLKSIMEINPVKFKYNGLGGYNDNGEEFIGVIAQDIHRVAPYMIKIIHKKLQESDSDNSELLMYDGTALDYLLINAVKEQQAQIEELKAENRKMQERLAAIEAMLDKNSAIEESVAKAEKP